MVPPSRASALSPPGASRPVHNSHCAFRENFATGLPGRRTASEPGGSGLHQVDWAPECHSCVPVSFTLENTHLFPSPLGIRWSFPDCASSPHTKQLALETFHGLRVSVAGTGACTRTLTYTRFCLGPCLQWPGKVHSESQIPALGPALLSCLCPPFMGSRKAPAHLLPVGRLLMRTADRERGSHLCVSSLPWEDAPLSVKSELHILGF